MRRDVPTLPAALATGGCLWVGGAFDGLSARLVERAGFQAIWASGFSISASKGLPDCNVMTATELVERVGEMVDSVAVPVVVDGDEGYGSLPGTLRLARQLALRGAAGLCLEDSRYPKTNSFCGVAERLLVEVEAFCAKLRAVKAAAPGLVLIARTESLLLDPDLGRAVARGRAYAESGADLVLLHSRYGELAPYRRMAEAWEGRAPLIVIPTLAPGVRFADLAGLGFRMVVYANQALRASIHILEQVLKRLRASGDPSRLLDSMVSMDHVFELTGLPPGAEVPALAPLASPAGGPR